MRILIIAAALMAPVLGWAHHGWSEYDGANALKLSGTIVESGYEHPHGHIVLQTHGKTWHVVLAPPSRMERRGLPKAALAPGAKVTVEGYPHRSKGDELRAERIHAERRTVELR